MSDAGTQDAGAPDAGAQDAGFTVGPQVLPATLVLTAYSPHAGQKIEFRVIDQGTNRTARASAVMAGDGHLTLTIDNAVGVGGRYYLDWYADMNGNGAYDRPPTDHSWRRYVTATATGATFSHTHDTNWTDLSPF